ncbi:LysE family translocator [Clostridium saccharobutylicum]|uniref:Putative threonine efflux protein n=1 Tax=Clostridium saccharobutylicum DSM 13864 TaxID=1345695 RepID=U5N139_CLOSA|nr:LysE family transporter [Clostridium saccharobutylicum]AGX45462.1 putative threonine efflux protein [Clostridium saccharobutylicum DSM 13864]AQR92735.1 LysE type translocator [Clostridium saccharobutylicum]AQS02637.1 LysE type translocator [Clostridium saccharobutylicum]AQS12243.1 LysE type translocator [Clostridium saccharobutylicum]AQS16620.1 LysE type translocator [Clostridium saccharobutylicum]
MFSIYNIFKAILVGFFTGFVASIPIGPSGIESVSRSISKGFKEGFKVSVGAVSADIVYIIIINLGLFTLLSNHHHFQSIFWIISGIILILFNRISLKSKTHDSNSKKLNYSTNSNGFLAGFLITFLNPTTPSMWIALSGTVLSVWRVHGRLFFIFAISSMIVGSITWFCLLNILVSKGFKKVKSNYADKTSNLLNYFLTILGAIFIIAGIYKFIF